MDFAITLSIGLTGEDRMSDWIERRFKEQKAQDQREQLEHATQLHRAKIIEGRGQDYMKQLTATAEIQSREFNEKFSYRRMNFQRVPRGFSVDIAFYPAGYLKCELDLAAQGIRAIVNRRQSASDSNEHEEYLIAFDVDQADNLVARLGAYSFNHPEHVAAHLLETMAFGSVGR